MSIFILVEVVMIVLKIIRPNMRRHNLAISVIEKQTHSNGQFRANFFVTLHLQFKKESELGDKFSSKLNKLEVTGLCCQLLSCKLCITSNQIVTNSKIKFEEMRHLQLKSNLVVFKDKVTFIELTSGCNPIKEKIGT